VLLTGVCAAIPAAAIAGYETQKRFNGIRYAGQDPTIDYALERLEDGERVGLAGTWVDAAPPVLAAFGPRLRNRVAYIGRDDGDFLRRYTERSEFVDSLRRGEFDYLFVGHGFPLRSRQREERWAESAGYQQVERSERLTLLRAPR
jgi:hypothetical protein